jgi:hypothetical protein
MFATRQFVLCLLKSLPRLFAARVDCLSVQDVPGRACQCRLPGLLQGSPTLRTNFGFIRLIPCPSFCIQLNLLEILTALCFLAQAGGHENHDYIMYTSDAGGCCDCGDISSWKV